MRHSFFIKSLSVICVILSLDAWAQSSDYLRGIEAFQKKDFKEAERNFLAAAAAEPKSPEIHTNLGLTYFELGDHPRAAAWFRRALSHDPLFGPARQGLGYLEGKSMVPSAAASSGGSFATVARLTSDFAQRIPPAALLVFVPLCLLGMGWSALSHIKAMKAAGPDDEKPRLPRRIPTFGVLTILGLALQLMQVSSSNQLEGTLIVGESSARSAPEEAAPVLFAIPGGSPLSVKNSQGDWLQVKTNSGDVGWIKSSDLLITSFKDPR